MMDDTVPFPAAETAAEADRKPRRRRGGARRHKGAAAGAEEPAAVPVTAAAATPMAAPSTPMSSPMSVSSAPPPTRVSVDQRLSLFIDFENIALGVRDAQYKKFDIHLVLQRLIEKGRIVFKKAYADWTRYSEYKREFHEAAIELIDIPQRNYTAQELGRHPDGRGRDGPRRFQGAHHDLRDRVRATRTSRRSSPSSRRTTSA